LPFAHSLSFDACFESGNLWKAVQVGEAEYDLFLRPDLHTDGHMQWFYFNVGNTHPPTALRNDAAPAAGAEAGDAAGNEGGGGTEGGSGCVEVKFNVVNLTKPDSLFNQGMQPLTFSLAEAKASGQGWVRAGRDVCYFPNSYARKEPSGAAQQDAEATATYFTLTFTLQFATAGDSTLVANAYPWTYADHRAHLALLLASPYARRHVVPSVLCLTHGDLACDLWTVTEDGRDDVPLLATADGAAAAAAGSNAHSKRKKCIVITGRVHPGETQASWMVKGILDFLCGDSPQARLLRSLFVFKVCGGGGSEAAPLTGV
jgi:hypothetical protein